MGNRIVRFSVMRRPTGIRETKKQTNTLKRRTVGNSRGQPRNRNNGDGTTQR